MKNKLAIIIPAFKITYFKETIQSFSIQTCKDFTLYIGDDNSPHDFKPIVDDCIKNGLEVVYKKFTENLGSHNLIAHWERCLDLVADEQWFCMFSDDDVVSSNLVEMFYYTLENRNDNYEVFHIDLNIIDSNSEIVRVCRKYPSKISSDYFFKLLFSRSIEARMPEFIFNKKSFLINGRFKHFDLGICSDNATVIINSYSKGIMTIPNAIVSWRESEESISANNSNKVIVRRKEISTYKFFDWTYYYFKTKNLKFPLPIYYQLRFLFGSVNRLSLFYDTKHIKKYIQLSEFFSRNIFFKIFSYIIIYCVFIFNYFFQKK